MSGQSGRGRANRRATGNATATPRHIRRHQPLPSAPTGALLASGSDLPPPLKRFRSGPVDESASGRYLEPPVQIAFPPDRAELEVEDGEGGSVVVKAEGGALPLTWLVDGVPIESDSTRREAELPAAGLGFHKLSVIDAKGRADRVTIRLK